VVDDHVRFRSSIVLGSLELVVDITGVGRSLASFDRDAAVHMLVPYQSIVTPVCSAQTSCVPACGSSDGRPKLDVTDVRLLGIRGPTAIMRTGLGEAGWDRTVRCGRLLKHLFQLLFRKRGYSPACHSEGQLVQNELVLTHRDFKLDLN